MTTEQAAAILGKTERYVRYLAKKGKLGNAIKAGRDWLIPESAVKSFVPEKRGPKGPRKGTS